MKSVTKIRILQAIRQGQVGGGETHVLDLVRSLDPDKFESVILSFTDGPMVDKLRSDGFKTYVIHTKKPFDFKVWNEVKKLVVKEKIDIIHAHGTRANSNTFASAKALKIPLLYTVHGWSFHPDQNFLVKFIRTLSERLLVQLADKTICVSQSNLNEGRSKFQMRSATVILNGVNQVKFNPSAKYSSVRNELGISDDVVLVGYIARITKQKDPFAFLEAIAKIPTEVNIKFLIVGDGDLKVQMLSKSKLLNIQDRIFFENFRDDIPAVLNSIDIFCLPSLWEGLPIALLEAMAMKKAIVATSIDGINDLIEHKQNGLLVSASNPSELSDSIVKLATDAQLRKQLGDNAWNTIDKKYNVNNMTNEIEIMYKLVFNNYEK